MQKTIFVFMLAAIFSLSTAIASIASEIEPVFSYQGFLTDDSGAPLNGTFDMNFMITDSTGSLWQELHIGVPVENGNFMVILGETDPIPPDVLVNRMDSSGYAIRNLQIQVGADPPMSPASRLLTVPYAVGAHRVAGDIFTSPGSIRMGVEPDPFLPLMEMNVFQDSASIRMGVEPEPFEPTVEINTNPNTSSFRMGVEPQPFQPAAEIIAGHNTTEFSMGIEPQPFNPAPEMEMLMDSNSTTFRMGVDPTPFSPSVEFQASTDMATFTMFDPTAGPDGGAISEMNAGVGGQFSWLMFNPQPEPPGRPIFDMNTGAGGELSWTFFNPQPEIPGRGILGMYTNSNGADFAMSSPQYGAVVDDITSPMIKLSTLGDVSTFQMLDPTAIFDDKTVSEMTSSMGGQFSWNLFLPDTNSQRQVMDMNTGPGGEINWIMFNPQPEPPGEPLIKMVTYGDPTGADILLYEPPPGTSASPNVDIYTQDGQGGIILRQSSTGFVQYQSPQTISFVDGGSGVSVGAISPASSSYLMGNFALGTSNATNILTVAQGSTTNPIAEAWTTYSSRRWKKNIRPINNALGKVERLRGVTFDWKADDRHDIGLIAEEVGEVVPEVVAYEENGVDAKSVDYARLVSVLIEAVKEQQAEIDNLKQRIEEIEMANKLSMKAIDE